jgi:hypothetical protein
MMHVLQTMMKGLLGRGILKMRTSKDLVRIRVKVRVRVKGYLGLRLGLRDL